MKTKIEDINKYTVLAAYCFWCKESYSGYARAFNNLTNINTTFTLFIEEAAAHAASWFEGTKASTVKQLHRSKIENIMKDITKLTEKNKAIQLDSLQFGHTFEHRNNLQERIKEIDSKVGELYGEIERLRNV